MPKRARGPDFQRKSAKGAPRQGESNGRGLAERPLREDIVSACSMEVLGAVLGERHLADRALERVLRRETRLYSNERRAVAERVYAALRRLGTVDFLIDDVLGARSKALVATDRNGLRLAIVRVLEGESFEAVKASTRLRLDHEGVVREVGTLSQRTAALAPLARLRAEGSLPEFLAERLLAQLDLEAALKLMAALNQRGPLTARANLLKGGREALSEKLKAAHIPHEFGRWSPWAVHLETRVNAFALSAFQEGFMELQDEGSQLLALLCDARPGERVVDACAGAGGKSLALAAAMENRGELIALDVNEERLEDARPRARRAGVSIVRTRRIPADGTADAQLADLAGRADRVLIDAPCSGLGALRRNPDARWRLQPGEIEKFATLQKELLHRFAPLVKPGGLLVYATCSVLQEENEQVVATPPKGFERCDVVQMLGGTLGRPLSTGGNLRLWPHEHGTDGFFAAAFRRERL